MAHTSDWLPTVIEGMFGYKLDAADAPLSNSTIRPVDGFNLWPAIVGGGPSPRSEVITQVSNQYFNTSTEGKGGMVIRSGPYKLLVGYPGDARTVPVPPLSETPVAFGKTGGVIEPGTSDHAVAPGFPKPGKANTSWCGGPSAASLDDGFCLFNVEKDPNEENDLASDPSYRSIAEHLMAKLEAAALTGPPVSMIVQKEGPYKAAICEVMRRNGGYVEPADTYGPLPPPPPPGPAPGELLGRAGIASA